MDQTPINDVVERHRHLEGPLLPILHGVQAELSCIPPDAVRQIADALNVTTAEVHGVVTFYHDFRTSPGGRLTIQVCCAEACQARGSRSLEAYATKALGVAYGETREDGGVTLERVYCLGNCACGPSVRIGDDIHGRVDATRFDHLIARVVP